jgi:hypothetical protein
MLNCRAEPFRTKHRIELAPPTRSELMEEQRRRSRRSDYYTAVRKQRRLISKLEAFFNSDFVFRTRRLLLVIFIFTAMAAVVYKVMSRLA